MQHTSFSAGTGGSTPVPSNKTRTPLKELNNSNIFSPMKNYGASSALDASVLIAKPDEKTARRLRELEEEASQLKASLQTAEKTIQSVRSERDKFESEVRRLTRTNNSNVIAGDEGKVATSGSSIAAGGGGVALAGAGAGVTGGSNWAKMTAQARETTRLEEESAQLKKKCAVLQAELDRSVRERSGHRERVDALESETDALKSELTHATSKLIDAMVLEKKYNEARNEVQEAAEHVSALEGRLVSSESALSAEQEEHRLLKEAHSELKNQFDDYKELHKSDNNHGHQGEYAVETDAAVVAELRQKLRHSEEKRRQLHAKVQELRGNVRVFVRVRPLLSGDKETRDSSVICNKDTNSIALIHSLPASGSGTACSSIKPLTHQFSFDKVFDQKTQQSEVFDDVSELVQSAMDGYRVCLFSYGQTGSGKTHTMTGEPTGQARGIIPRSMELVLKQAQEMRAAGQWSSVRISMSIAELYNEELRDLLPVNNCTSNEKEKLRISFQGGKVTVAGLSSHEISMSIVDSDDCDTTAGGGGGGGAMAAVEHGLAQLRSLLARANSSRTTAATNMNDHSSRSHVIYMIDIYAARSAELESSGDDAGAGAVTVMEGGLRLVDLAGSERVDRTGTAGDATRFKESININKSLSCIADVFTAMGNRTKAANAKGGAAGSAGASLGHVPFRNSKLTMLLQDCLCGEGKALMMVNVSPTEASLGESLCSLRFAGQVNQVELGRAKKHTTAALVASAPASALVALPPPPPTTIALAPAPAPATIAVHKTSVSRRSQSNFNGSGVAGLTSSATRIGNSGTTTSAPPANAELASVKPSSVSVAAADTASTVNRRRVSAYLPTAIGAATKSISSNAGTRSAAAVPHAYTQTPAALSTSLSEASVTTASENFYARKLAASTASASAATTTTTGAKRLNCSISGATSGSGACGVATDTSSVNAEPPVPVPFYKRSRSISSSVTNATTSSSSSTRGVFTNKITL